MGGAKKWKMAAFVASIATVILFFSCEDPGILKANENFLRSKLRTVYVDTFSIVGSTVQLDSLPSSGNGNNVLVGNYKDNLVGQVSASSYFQIAYSNAFAPDTTSIFDSIALVLPYSRYWYGDTTRAQTLNVHELTQQPIAYSLPRYREDDPISIFSTTSGFYNSSKVQYNPTPILSTSVTFFPHRDSLFLKLPSAIGQNWFKLGQQGSVFFNTPGRFINEFFQGIYLTTDNSNDASVVGFRTNRIKVRIYFRKLVDDSYQKASFDFPIFQTQFNNIQTNRSTTPLSGLQPRKSIASSLTNNVTYVQSGTGLVTKLEFPGLKDFLKDKKNVLLDAVLEVYPAPATYLGNAKPPTTLALYSVNVSNVPSASLGGPNNYLAANIQFDYEYEQQTKYAFSLINYLTGELTISNKEIEPILIAAPAPNIFTEINRVALSTQQNLTTSKTKLKIYYSYVSN